MLIVVSILLAIIPTLLWFSIDPSPLRFSSIELTLTSVGQITGLIGLSLFAFNTFLSARFKWFEKVFGPLNRIYVYHHLSGILVWILLIIHPLGLLSTYGIRLLFPYYGNWARNLGLASLLFFDTLIILTLFIKIPYHVWKNTHKLMGLVLAMGAIHSFFVPSDISTHTPLRIYMFSILVISFGAYLFHTVLGKRFVKKTSFMVTRVTPLSNATVTEIAMTPLNKNLIFSPGQFGFFTFDSPKYIESHPFSFTSNPADQLLTIAAKNSGDYTSRLSKLTPGVTARIEGPFGQFSYVYHSRPRQIWVAGGIGITPFVSMAKSLPTSNFQVDLFYAVKSESEAVYHDVFTQITKSNPNFRYILWNSEKAGRISATNILSPQEDLKKLDIFICGPLPMMKSLRSQFNKMQVRHSHIHTEEFNLY